MILEMISTPDVAELGQGQVTPFSPNEAKQKEMDAII